MSKWGVLMMLSALQLVGLILTGEPALLITQAIYLAAAFFVED